MTETTSTETTVSKSSTATSTTLTTTTVTTTTIIKTITTTTTVTENSIETKKRKIDSPPMGDMIKKKIFICNKCEYTTESKYNYDRHNFLNKYKCSKEYICTFCQKKFKGNNYLKNHMLVNEASDADINFH